MFKKYEFEIRLVLFLILGLALVIGICALEGASDDDAWNGGYCEAGHEWELFDVEVTKNDTFYFYRCECGEVIQLYNRR